MTSVCQKVSRAHATVLDVCSTKAIARSKARRKRSCQLRQRSSSFQRLSTFSQVSSAPKQHFGFQAFIALISCPCYAGQLLYTVPQNDLWLLPPHMPCLADLLLMPVTSTTQQLSQRPMSQYVKHFSWQFVLLVVSASICGLPQIVLTLKATVPSGHTRCRGCLCCTCRHLCPTNKLERLAQGGHLIPI